MEPIVPLNCKEQESSTTAFLNSIKPSRIAYQKLVKVKSDYKISSQKKWSNVFPKYTKSTKLIEFQFTFLHQTLATNVSLVKMGYKDDISTFCHEKAENFTHLFWFCSNIELFWKHLIASLKDRNFLSNDCLLNNVHVVLGPKPDTSKTKLH